MRSRRHVLSIALGIGALRALVAGRVALVPAGIVSKLAIACAVICVVLAVLHARSRRMRAPGVVRIALRASDVVFDLMFGALIAQCVAMLGMLPVLAQLVVLAIAGGFLFGSACARLWLGGAFAALASMVGLEIAQLDRASKLGCLCRPAATGEVVPASATAATAATAHPPIWTSR